MIVPMLGRAWAVEPLAESLAASDPDRRCCLTFVVSATDTEVQERVKETGCGILVASWPVGPGDYARKINLGASRSTEPWVFTGASDIRFSRGWADAAIRAAGGHERFAVIGTNDLGNAMVRQGRHSTHTLVRRDYIAEAVIDQPFAVYSTAYDHNYCDMELIDYATFKGRFRAARQSIVEHFHPDWRKADEDATYRRGRAGFRADQKLYMERRKLWRGRTVQEQRRLARATVRPDQYRIR